MKINVEKYKDILNTDQHNILHTLYAEIMSAINGEFTTKIASLQGSAGVGKTFLLSILINELSKHNTVRVTAPTHKAVKVLKQKLKDNQASNKNITISTIHSYLKLKLQNNFDTGLTELVKDTIMDLQKNKKDIVDILIVDESSMISNQLYTHILEKLDSGSIKFVLMVGDIFQLPPVDCDTTIPVTNISNLFTLTQVVRQAEDNEVIQQAQFLKRCIEQDRYVAINELFKTCNKNIISLYDPKQFMQLYLQDIYNNKDSIVLAYTNESVDKYNKGIRKILKGDIPQFIIGDEVIFNEAYNPDSTEFPLYANNDIIKIGLAELRYHEVQCINYWILKEISNNNGEDVLNPAEIYVVHENSIEYYKYLLQQIANKAKISNGKEKKQYWSEYFALKNKYSDIRYTYATTIHKSQGSTYDNIFFNIKALEKLTYIDYQNLYRLIYVGITRTSNNVYILRE